MMDRDGVSIAVGKNILRHDLLYLFLVQSPASMNTFNQCSDPRNLMPPRDEAIKTEISVQTILYLLKLKFADLSPESPTVEWSVEI